MHGYTGGPVRTPVTRAYPPRGDGVPAGNARRGSETRRTRTGTRVAGHGYHGMVPVSTPSLAPTLRAQHVPRRAQAPSQIGMASRRRRTRAQRSAAGGCGNAVRADASLALSSRSHVFKQPLDARRGTELSTPRFSLALRVAPRSLPPSEAPASSLARSRSDHPFELV